MKKLFLSLLVTLLPLVASADTEVTIEYIRYSLITKLKTAEVIKRENGCYYSGYVVIPETVEYEGKTYSVTSIGPEAFSDERDVTGVIIPNSVTSIGDKAFYNCSGMTSVIIGNSVTSIGEYAFYRCPLSSAKIPNSVTSIGNYAFHWCRSMDSLIIGNSVTSIGFKAFSYCPSLTSVKIPNSVTSIGNSAFC